MVLVLGTAPSGRSVPITAPASPVEASEEDGLRRFEYSILAMGTLFRLVLYAPDAQQAAAAAEASFERVRDLDRRLSDYRPESELNQLCRTGFRAPAIVSPELYVLLAQAQRWSRLSGGAFDATMGPLVRLWRDARRLRRLPTTQEIESARERTGYQKLVLNPLTGSVRLRLAGMQLDLGGIAKGYAADQALEVLQQGGVSRALVEAGGDVRLGEPPPGEAGWRVELEGSGGPVQLTLSRAAVATSGDDQQFVELEGRRYSHIVDPRTGMALTNRRLVTVVAPDAAGADALATALSVMEPEAGLKLAASLPRTWVRMESRSLGRVWMSSGFPD